MDTGIHEASLHSICVSISGEVSHVPTGTKTAIVRFAGCNLACPYCDTSPTQKKENGKKLTHLQIAHMLIAELSHREVRHVMFTGGEPLLYEDAIVSIIKEVYQSHREDITYSVETNGTLHANKLHGMAYTMRIPLGFVVDIKLDQITSPFVPSGYNGMIHGWAVHSSSYEHHSSHHLRNNVIFKIVCASKKDVLTGTRFVNWLCMEVGKENNPAYGVFFSPVFSNGKYDSLVLQDMVGTVLGMGTHFNQRFRSNVRTGISLQLHKIIDCP